MNSGMISVQKSHFAFRKRLVHGPSRGAGTFMCNTLQVHASMVNKQLSSIFNVPLLPGLSVHPTRCLSVVLEESDEV